MPVIVLFHLSRVHHVHDFMRFRVQLVHDSLQFHVQRVHDFAVFRVHNRAGDGYAARIARPRGWRQHAKANGMPRKAGDTRKWRQDHSEQQGHGTAVHESERQDPQRVAGPTARRCV